jgi:aspartate/methionine/tyrosine aminotransferase
MRISKRGAVSAFTSMDVLAAANRMEREGRSVVHMELGEPGAPPPRAVREAAIAALQGGRIGYTEALGSPDLRRRIARHYADRYGVVVPAERVAVTSGSSAAFNLAFLALFDVGDRIGLPTPGYPAYRNILTALGLVVVDLPTTAESRWQVTADHLDEAVRDGGPLAGLIVASPANPSGTMMEPEAIRRLVGDCRDRNVTLVMDEIYHGLSYAGVEETALAHGDDVVVVNSFSKYYCMTGWRIGWMVLPEALVRPAERLAQNLYISPSDIAQRAAVAAFDATEELEAVKAGYAESRRILLDRFPRMGLGDFMPVDGAFYVYADVRHLTNDSRDFAARMLAEAGVAVSPGTDFDPARGFGTVRFSFAGGPATVTAACDRLDEWLRRPGGA